MSDRADELAATHVRVLATDDSTWGIDIWGAFFPCDGDTQDDVVAIAGDIRRGLARTLRAYAEEARQEEQRRWIKALCISCAPTHVLENGRVWGFCGTWKVIPRIPEEDIATAIRAVRPDRVEHSRQEEQREPSSWRCHGCGVTFSRDPGSDAHPVHDPRCDGSCDRGYCPVQCGPIEADR